jgi:hypothetical protein
VARRHSGQRNPAGANLERSEITDPDLLDHPVMMAPVLDQLDMAPVMPVVAPPLPVIVLIVTVIVIVLVVIVVDLAIVVAANLYFTVVGKILIAVVGLDDHTGSLRRCDDSGRSGKRDHGSDYQVLHR